MSGDSVAMSGEGKSPQVYEVVEVNHKFADDLATQCVLFSSARSPDFPFGMIALVVLLISVYTERGTSSSAPRFNSQLAD
jgi:hypothetical protein